MVAAFCRVEGRRFRLREAGCLALSRQRTYIAGGRVNMAVLLIRSHTGAGVMRLVYFCLGWVLGALA